MSDSEIVAMSQHTPEASVKAGCRSEGQPSSATARWSRSACVHANTAPPEKQPHRGIQRRKLAFAAFEAMAEASCRSAQDAAVKSRQIRSGEGVVRSKW